MKKLLLKTILVAAAMCVGTNAWAYDVPSGYEIKTVYVGTNNGDGTVNADAFDYESVPAIWVGQSGCALSIKNITYVENAEVGSTPAVQPTYVNGKTLCTTVSGTNWECHYSRYTMAETVNSGCLVFRADMYCSNSPTYIRFLDDSENEILRLGFNNGSGDKYYQYVVNGGTASNSDMHTTYRTYHGFALEDLVINLSTGAVSFWLDYINTNSSNQRTQVTNTKNINIGTGKNIKYIELGSVVNNSQSVSFDNIKFYYVDRTVDKYTYSINAVDGDDNLLKTLVSGWCYSDEPSTTKWSKYIKVNDIWYSTSSSTFTKEITKNTNENVTYAETNIEYFYEMEKLTRSGGISTTETSSSYSNGTRIRLARGSLYYTPALAGGTYRLLIPWENGNSSESEVYVYTRTAGGELSEEKLATFKAPKGSGTFQAIVEVPNGYSLAFNGNEGGSANNNARMDYFTLRRLVTVALGPNGYTTFSSAYPLDLGSMTASEGEVIAYYVTSVQPDKAILGRISENVEAGEGLILRGTPNATITIPVAASGDAITNYLVGCPTATELTTPNSSYYVLVNNGENVEFQPLSGTKYTNNKVTIPAGKAYLNYAGAGAARLSIVFDDETTGVQELKNSRIEGLKTGNYYNLSGQRVAMPTKGLYIVNGKKVVVK